MKGILSFSLLMEKKARRLVQKGDRRDEAALAQGPGFRLKQNLRRQP